jgi:hypothetical protein
METGATSCDIYAGPPGTPSISMVEGVELRAGDIVTRLSPTIVETLTLTETFPDAPVAFDHEVTYAEPPHKPAPPSPLMVRVTVVTSDGFLLSMRLPHRSVSVIMRGVTDPAVT